MIGIITEIEKQFVGGSQFLIPLLKDPDVTDILINGTHSLYVDKLGEMSVYGTPVPDLQTLSQMIERMVIPTGKRIDASKPYLDGKLVDGSRFHIILPPIARDGAIISIRKHKTLSERGTLLESFAPKEAVKLLRSMMESRSNLLIAGATGVGKTTLLCELLQLIPASERILVIEETLEIQTNHPHVVHLEARGQSPDGRGEVTLRDLIKNALRMRPDRLILGECRGEEVKELLQALNTGHGGSLCTIHANSAQEALRRLETLLLISAPTLNVRIAREWISHCIQGVIYLERLKGSRQITQILQVQGLEGEVYRIHPRYDSFKGVNRL